MKAEVDQLRRQMGGEDFFNQAGLDFARDAWGAAKFGCGRSASLVRLHGGERPDFEIQFVDGKIEAFEFTEAQVRGRRRGTEYENTAPSTEEWPVEKWPTKDQIFEIVRDAASLKREKARKLAARGTPYQQGVGLFIYLNIFDFWNEDEQKNIVYLMGDAVRPAKDEFCSVWVSWHGALYDLS
ncbi:MAG: hypothetical protein U1E25_14415 [Methylocystis sp.]